MKWTWPTLCMVVVITTGLVTACGFLIAYLRPSEETINQRMDPDDNENGRGEGSGKLNKQQVNSRTGGIKLHLLEVNKETEGGNNTASHLGDHVVMGLIIFGIVVFLSMCAVGTVCAWKWGCFEGRAKKQ